MFVFVFLWSCVCVCACVCVRAHAHACVHKCTCDEVCFNHRKSERLLLCIKHALQIILLKQGVQVFFRTFLFKGLSYVSHICYFIKIPVLFPASISTCQHLYFQIVSPIDKGISKSILDNLEPLESSWNISVVANSPLCKDPYEDALKGYNAAVQSLCYHRYVSCSDHLVGLVDKTGCQGYVCVCVSVCLSVCLSSLVCVVGLFLCTLMQYIGFMGVLFYA